MSLRDVCRHAGQFAIIGFEGVTVAPELRSLVRDFDLGGVILFGRNVESPQQVAELAREIGEIARDVPLWIGVDQEGGRVARLRAPFTEWPPMAALGRSANSELVERFARALAAELRSVGISLDFTPVLDINTNPANPVIGDRALSDRADEVARAGSAIIRTLQAAGLAACGKHFPGHGDTSADSHEELPLVEHPPERIRAVELVPFGAAVQAGVAAIMTAHILVPSLDAENPATMSRRIVKSLLRDELGFQGLVVSDDLEMRAIGDRYSFDRAAVGALAAGCDAILMCGFVHDRQVAALEAIIRAAESGELPLKDLEDSLARQRDVKARFLGPEARRLYGPVPLWRQCVGSDEHRRLAEEIAQYA